MVGGTELSLTLVAVAVPVSKIGVVFPTWKDR